MSNKELYIKSFVETFDIDETSLEKLEYQGIQEWDSVGHMTLIATLEECFNIEMDIDDITDLSSFEFGKKIMAKYGVDVD